MSLVPAAKVRTKPVRAHSYDDGLQTHVVRGIGFSSECSCGWRSDIYEAWNDAAAAGRAHTDEHDGRRGA